MSFVRTGRPQQHSKAKRPVRAKKAAATRREWVSTVNDLSVHKLTPAELRHRHEIHKSHNKVAAQWELREKALKRRLRHNGSPEPLDQNSLSIIREVFSDQLLLQDVLARSDRAMAVVKDLFGDAPRRQIGHPSVTMAPNCDSDSELPVLQRPDPPTHLSLLSQSMMDQQALNEFEDQSDKDPYPCGSSAHPVIQRANIRKMTHSQGRVVQHLKDQYPNYHQPDGDNVPVTPCTSARVPEQSALNATVAVQRVRSRQRQLEDRNEEPSVFVSHVLNPDVPINQSEKVIGHTSRRRKCASQGLELDGSSISSLNGDRSSLGMLQAMLGQVEVELNTLGPDTAPASVQNPNQHRTQGLTGFSVALVTALGRLVHLFKQREEEVQKESQERRRLEEELKEQRGLIDALTAETMTLREEVVTLQGLLQRQTTELEQKLDTVILLMGGSHADQPHYSDCQSAPVPEQIPLPEVAVPAAVLLSPPRQIDNVQHIPSERGTVLSCPVRLHQHLCPVDKPFKDPNVCSSGSSPTSLPPVSLLSTSSESLSSHIASEAMLAEITQLSRQNDLLRAQLSQVKGLRPEGIESHNGSTKDRRSSPCSTGRSTPNGIKERSMSEFNSTDRRSQKIQAPDRDLPAHKSTSLNNLSVSSVEQRLLVLNQQSAAARGRLLEIIEQQKQSVSSKVSPSVSPIPQSTAFTFSSQTSGGGRSPNISANELLSQTGGSEERSAVSEVSFLSAEGETTDGKSQTRKRNVQEGWFALSNHVR